MRASFLIAAGGTGGHVYPALAVAQELAVLRPEARIHFVGGRRGIEGRLVRNAGFSITRLPSAGLRGLGVLGAIRFAVAFGLAFVAALPLVLRLKPRVVLATGGYASAAPAVAARLLGRPLWIQEQNAVPGSTNRFLSRFAERAYVAFEAAAPLLRHARRVESLPNPVRREILESRGRTAGTNDYEALGLNPGRATVLLFGGSRGAATLNRALREAWPSVRDGTQWQLLAQTGERERDATAQALREGSKDRARVLDYIDDMAQAYAVADVVVCRAGALTLAELAAVGKPAVLVPFPHATDDHQMKNALAVAEAGAARVVEDAAFDGRVLAELLLEFEQNPAALEAMGEAAAKIAAGRNGAAELAAALAFRADPDTRREENS